MSSIHRPRLLFVAFTLSMLLHLLVLFLPGPDEEARKVRRFRVRSLPSAHQIESFQPQAPHLPQRHMQRLPAPAFSRPSATPLPTRIPAGELPVVGVQ